MNVYEQIKQDSLAARKAKDSAKIACLLPLLSDIQKIGKDQQREITDDDCFTVLKSTIKNLHFVIDKAVPGAQGRAIAMAELEWLSKYMPVMPDTETLFGEALELKATGLSKGEVIKRLKQKYGLTLDVRELAAKL